jgi:hypothetical protein
MPRRQRGTPGGVIPSPTGGGLTGAVAGFAEMREMARRARMEEQQHDLEMQRFQAQLRESEMGAIANQIGLLQAVAQPGQTLGELAPGMIGQLSQAIGTPPEQTGQAVLKPLGPEHIISQGVQSFLDQASPEDLARIGEVAASQGRTIEEIQGAAAQGNYTAAVATLQTDWIRNNPTDFEAAIAQELGPDQLYSVNVFGHNIELTGRDAAGTLLDMQRLLDARQQGQGQAAAENRERLIQWGKSIAEDLDMTGGIPIINEMVDMMTDPDLDAEQYSARVQRLVRRSPEAAQLVKAMTELSWVGTNAMLNQYRDDPELGPVINMLDFARGMMETGAFTADQGVPMLKSLGDILKARGISGVSTGFPIFGSEGFDVPDPIERIKQRFGGELSNREIESAIGIMMQDSGLSRPQVIQELLTGNVSDMQPATGPAVEPTPAPTEPQGPTPELEGAERFQHQEVGGERTPSFAREMARRQLDEKQRQLAFIEERGTGQRGVERRAEQLRAEIARLQSIIQGGG